MNEIDYTEVNPIDKKDEVCDYLNRSGLKYEIHDDPEEQEYEYLEEGAICITVVNPSCAQPLFIDLDYSEFTLTYQSWHTHYLGEQWQYDDFMENMKAILENKKCSINIYSNERWLSSVLSNERLDEHYDYKANVKRLPAEFRKEIKDKGGRVELVYWDITQNILIEI